VTRQRALHLWALAWLVGVLSVAVVVNPVLAVAGALVVFVFALATRFRTQLPQLFLSVLGMCLLGYAFLGRGFAYLGAPPMYVGEITLSFGLLCLLLSGGLARVFRSPLAWLLVVLMALGTAATLPYVGRYGLDAFRDAVVWGYGLVALLAAAFLLKAGWLHKALGAYGRTLPWFLTWTPAAVLIYRLALGVIPKLPGSGVPLLNPKGGDIAVHLAGALAFLVLGLHGLSPRSRRRIGGREWLWWMFWLVACLSIFTGRAAILTVATVTLLLMVLRPLSRWGKVLFLVVLFGVAFIASDIEINLGTARSVSAEDLVLTVHSIFGDTGESVYDGTRNWRIMWWKDIFNYTVFGEYFWTGKGYGINLADADGYQVLSDHSLRSPHNSHLTFLARGGIPSALAWLILQGTFALLLVRAYVRARRLGQEDWAKVNLWILAYWLAFMVNGAFDVFLEGPQGGIWFWSVFGFGLAALEQQRRGLTFRGEKEPG